MPFKHRFEDGRSRSGWAAGHLIVYMFAGLRFAMTQFCAVRDRNGSIRSDRSTTIQPTGITPLRLPHVPAPLRLANAHSPVPKGDEGNLSHLFIPWIYLGLFVSKFDR